MKTRTIVCILALLSVFLALPVFAQEPVVGPENFIGFGVSYNQYVEKGQQISGNLLYARRATADRLYSFTFVDVVSKESKEFSTATSITEGIGLRTASIGKVGIYATTGVGVMAGYKDVGYSWTGGMALGIPLGKGWAVMPNVRFLKSSLTDYQYIGGIMIGFGK